MSMLRYWRTNSLGCRLLRISLFNVHLRTIKCSEAYCLVNTEYGRIKRRSYTTLAAFKCWNCKTKLDTRPCLFCKNCSLIQSCEQQNFNYFELFNMDVHYDIDTGQLTSNYRKLQNVIHPDKFSNKTEEELILSESFSSLLNKAYSTLLNPLLRGLYLLNVYGLSIEEGSITMNTTFLGEIMEWNEQVEEASTKESLEHLKKDIDVILVNLYMQLSEAFNDNNLIQAKILLSKAKYFSSLQETIKEKDVQ